MSEHTPGEWHVRPNNDRRFTLLEQQSSDPSSPEARANARLFEAAPDLLEACKAMLDALERYGHPDKTDRKMRAAIQKAEREQ